MGTTTDLAQQIAIVADSRQSLRFLQAVALLSGCSQIDTVEFRSCVSLFRRLEAGQRFDLYVLEYEQRDTVSSNSLPELFRLDSRARIVVISNVLDPYAADRFEKFGALVFYELNADVEQIASYMRHLLTEKISQPA